MVILDEELIVFGGILEVTKESDEIFAYNFGTQQWTLIEIDDVKHHEEIIKEDPAVDLTMDQATA